MFILISTVYCLLFIVEGGGLRVEGAGFRGTAGNGTRSGSDAGSHQCSKATLSSGAVWLRVRGVGFEVWGPQQVTSPTRER